MNRQLRCLLGSDDHRRRGLTLTEVLVGLAVVAGLVGLLMPAVQKVRAAAARGGCQDRLRQIALAATQYEAAKKQLPPGQTAPAKGELYPHLGWLARLLPSVEQEPLWRDAQVAYAAKPGFPFATPHTGIFTPVKVFACPADPRQFDAHDTHDRLRAAVTGYLGVLGTDHTRRDGVLYRGSRVRMTDITDGASNTLLAGERPPSPDFWFGWWYASGSPAGAGDTALGVRELNPYQDGHTNQCPAGPYHFRPARPEDMCATYQFWSLHPGGANFAFCDGSVRFLPYSADSILPALATRAGGEVVAVD